MDYAGWVPDPALAAFLSAGPPPICVGFGSVTDNDAGRGTELILDPFERGHQRAIIAPGWGRPRQYPQHERTFTIDEAPYDRLLLLCGGILHHGGAGTIAAAIRAGLPQVVAPVIADQPSWADRVRQLGVAALTTPKGKLTIDRLCTACRRLTDDTDRRRCAADLSRRVCAEDGLAITVARIETILTRSRRAAA